MKNAEVTWLDGDKPHSKSFGDHYFSDGGFEETNYVFIEQSALAEKMLKKNSLVIVESGFGTSLNFLATWNHWCKSSKPCTLHYISVEKYPLKRDDLKKSIKNWPQLKEYGDEFR